MPIIQSHTQLLLPLNCSHLNKAPAQIFNFFTSLIFVFCDILFFLLFLLTYFFQRFLISFCWEQRKREEGGGRREKREGRTRLRTKNNCSPPTSTPNCLSQYHIAKLYFALLTSSSTNSRGFPFIADSIQITTNSTTRALKCLLINDFSEHETNIRPSLHNYLRLQKRKESYRNEALRSNKCSPCAFEAVPCAS